MIMTIDHDGAVPVHQQLANILRERIVRGEIELDCPIPSDSSLRRQYGLDLDSVHRAVQVLRDEGLLYTLEGQGDYVSSRAAETGGG
ncbi:GntR family transcriptional regulator [Streptosporangium sp. NPDC000396]|uniref:GntR family transcriptional regulator n=1 Tax=Streptosporangium sp. NPDC000396 TaxID=3366185 RepID=UPI0036C03487